MSNFYNLDGIKTDLQKKIAAKKALLAAWENVTFPTKKDGNPFANMSKNISGATYRNKDYTMQPEKELYVHVWADMNGYIYDIIDCCELVKYLTDPAKVAKTDNYAPKLSYLEQLYNYDLEDIKEAINKRIAYLKNRITCLNCQLDIVETCYNEFKAGFGKLVSDLENQCSEAGSVGYSGNVNDIYYDIKDTVINRYPYC